MLSAYFSPGFFSPGFFPDNFFPAGPAPAASAGPMSLGYFPAGYFPAGYFSPGFFPPPIPLYRPPSPLGLGQQGPTDGAGRLIFDGHPTDRRLTPWTRSTSARGPPSPSKSRSPTRAGP